MTVANWMQHPVVAVCFDCQDEPEMILIHKCQQTKLQQ